jgi:hypothetical protein
VAAPKILPRDFLYNLFVVALFTTIMRSERFSTKLDFLKKAVEHALLANLKPFVEHLPNTCLIKNPSNL